MRVDESFAHTLPCWGERELPASCTHDKPQITGDDAKLHKSQIRCSANVAVVRTGDADERHAAAAGAASTAWSRHSGETKGIPARKKRNRENFCSSDGANDARPSAARLRNARRPVRTWTSVISDVLPAIR